MNWIDDYVAIGDVGDVENNPTYMQNLRVDIVNVSECFEAAENKWNVIPGKIDEIVDYIINNAVLSKKTFLYSADVEHGAGLAAAVYLMRKHNINLDSCCEIVSSNRPGVVIPQDWIMVMMDELMIDEDRE